MPSALRLQALQKRPNSDQSGERDPIQQTVKRKEPLRETAEWKDTGQTLKKSSGKERETCQSPGGDRHDRKGQQQVQFAIPDTKLKQVAVCVAYLTQAVPSPLPRLPHRTPPRFSRPKRSAAPGLPLGTCHPQPGAPAARTVARKSSSFLTKFEVRWVTQRALGYGFKV